MILTFVPEKAPFVIVFFFLDMPQGLHCQQKLERIVGDSLEIRRDSVKNCGQVCLRRVIVEGTFKVFAELTPNCP